MLSSAVYYLAAGMLAMQPAAADFVIYMGASNDFVPGAGPGGGVAAATNKSLFFNRIPGGCDDGAQVSVVSGLQDVSGDHSPGYVCDGCDTSVALEDQVPERYEMKDDGDIFEGGVHMTLYKDEGANTYGIYDTEMNSLGSCKIPDERPSLTCAHAIFGVTSSVLFWECSSDLSVRDSN